MRTSGQENHTLVSTAERRLAKFVFLAICIETLFSIFYRTIHLATHSAFKSWVVGLLGLLLAGMMYHKRRTLAGVAVEFYRRFSETWSSVFVSLGVGLLLRLVWVSQFHSALTSDGEGYFAEAVSLVRNHTYGGPYWPPGFPFFLSPFLAILGCKQWVTVFCSLLLFVVTAVTARSLAIRMSGSIRAGVLSSWILALWPGYIAVVNINCKEVLLACLLTGIIYFLFAAQQQNAKRKWLATCAAGILVGFAALTQPGFMLFPGVLFVSVWLTARRFASALLQTVVIVGATLAVVLPWSARNQAVYHHRILVSTNGGSVFYTANNPKANASYSEDSQRDLPADTIAADQLGYRLGKQWIREHPLDFAVLSIRKQVVFLGDDGIGIYESLKRGRAPSSLVYNSLKGICSLYWLAIWITLLCCWKILFRRNDWTVWFGLTFLPFVYQWAIDSIFESGSRHHLAYVGCLAVLLSVALTTAKDDEILIRKNEASYRMLCPM